MKITILRVVIVVFFLTSSQVYADTPKGIKGKGAMNRGVDKSAPADRIADEAADAVTDILTGKDSQGSSGNTPPGLAKQGKAPHGWDKGKKAGWNKEETVPPISSDRFLDRKNREGRQEGLLGGPFH